MLKVQNIVPQDNVLFEQLSVKDNLKFWYSAYGLNKNDIFSSNSIESILGLKPFLQNKASILSGEIKNLCDKLLILKNGQAQFGL